MGTSSGLRIPLQRSPEAATRLSSRSDSNTGHRTRQPLVAVFLGTDHHPFDRLVEWVSELAVMGDCQWFVQYGSTAAPTTVDGTQMLGESELEDLLRRADAVVTHGGPGLIMEARAVGHVPVVVPRDPLLGEHVDGHQQRFCHRAEETGLLTRVSSKEGLRDAVAQAVRTGRRRDGGGGQNVETTRRFGFLVEQLVGARV